MYGIKVQQSVTNKTIVKTRKFVIKKHCILADNSDLKFRLYPQIPISPAALRR